MEMLKYFYKENIITQSSSSDFDKILQIIRQKIRDSCTISGET